MRLGIKSTIKITVVAFLVAFIIGAVWLMPSKRAQADSVVLDIGWRSPSWSNEIAQVVEFNNGTKSKVDFDDVTWSDVSKAGLWLGDEKKNIAGFDRSYGQIILYPKDYDEPPIHLLTRVIAKKGTGTYTKWITDASGIQPYWSGNGTEKEFGYKRNVTQGSFVFPVSIGVKGDIYHEVWKIPINITTPTNLDDVAVEYIMAVNPAFTEQAKKLKYIQVVKKDFYNETLEEWNYTMEKHELNQLLDKSGEVSNMTSTFSFLTESNQTISLIDFEKEFNQSHTIEWKIKQVTLPNGQSTYILSLTFWFGSLSSGSTLSLNADWTTPTAISSKSNEGSSYPATRSIDDNNATDWRELVGGGDGSIGEWYITFDMGSTQTIEKIRIYADGNVFLAPCKVNIIKVCDDSACSGESDLISSDCSFSTTLGWQECDFADTSGRYIYLEGMLWYMTSPPFTYGCGKSPDDDMRYFYEFDSYVTATTTTTTTTTIPAISISISSPTNTTYTSAPVNLNATTNATAASCAWNINGTANASMSNSSTTAWYSSINCPEGTHHLFVYCNNSDRSNVASNTTIWFTYTATDATFSIAMPGDYTSWTAITGTAEGSATATDWISFNFTNVPENFCQPYQVGDSGKTQEGATAPIFYVDVTGNTAIDVSLKFNQSLPAGIVVGGNATCSGTYVSCQNALQSIGTSYVKLVDGLSQTTSFGNITLYANVSAGTAPDTDAGGLNIYIYGAV